MNEKRKNINRRKKLDHAHSTELLRCRIFFNDFLKKFPLSLTVDFKKIFELVKVPFTSLPSMLQIKALFQIYLSREKRRFYMKKGLWSQKELKILLWALAIHSEHTGRGIDEFLDEDWHEISQLFVSSNAMKCKAKWLSIKRSKHLQVKWTQEEDNQLFLMMKQAENKKRVSWNEMATSINNMFYNGDFMRTGRQCRDRWVHHLNPKFCRVQWSIDEDLKILRFVMENGKKWAVLSRIMENRNEDSIRNRFIKLIKSYRKKEKIDKNSPKKKFQRKIFSKLLIELDKQKVDEENKIIQNQISNLGKKRQREQDLEMDQVVKEQGVNGAKPITAEQKQEDPNNNDNNRKVAKFEEISKKKNFERGDFQFPETKIEPTITVINNFANKNTNQNQNQNQMGEILGQMEVLKKQIFQQEIMMQYIQFMISNLIWNSSINNTIIS